MPKNKAAEETKADKPESFLSQNRIDLLSEIKELNSKISRKQRANLFEPLKDYLTKPVFNQIVRGIFVSVNNVPIANLIKSKMESLVQENEKIFQN